MKIDIKTINGAEIIEFLNNTIKEDLDIQMNGPFKFGYQEINDCEYKLSFDAYYNNWGTDQLVEDNYIKIYEDKVVCWPNEPFDGDGSAEILEDFLTKWLETHNFEFDRERIFISKMEEIYETLPQIAFNDIKSIDETIEKLEIIKSFMI